MYGDEFEEMLAFDEADTLEFRGTRIASGAGRAPRRVYDDYQPDIDTSATDAEMARIRAETARMEAAINRMNAAQSKIEEEMQRESSETARMYKAMEAVERSKDKIRSLDYRIAELREQTKEIQRGI